MKYVIVLGDGMAGRPLQELGGRTTLQAAETNVMDRLAREGEIGMAAMVPDGMEPGSDTANLSVLGYDPKIYFTGRSPLEALSIGAEMKDTDVSFRCNLVTLSGGDCEYASRKMIDHSSGEISTEDAAVLVEALKEGLKSPGYAFYAGTSYRHLLIQENGTAARLTPPHDILDKCISEYLPEDEVLREMMEKSYEILRHHPINEKRREQGLHTADSAWFWGAGTKPSLESFQKKTGKKGVMISAVDLLKGIAAGTGMGSVEVPGANGGLHTNYEGKAKAAVDALTKEGYDFAYIHIEAPDEMGHQGLINDKITAIENIDGRVLANVIGGLFAAGEDFRVMILPDHPTPVSVRTHTGEPVPYLIYDSRKAIGGADTYNESEAAKSGRCWKDGYCLIDHLLELSC